MHPAGPTPAGPPLCVPHLGRVLMASRVGVHRSVSPLPTEEPAEREKVEQAAECCREILHHVNQAVRDMEDLLVSLGVALAPGSQWPLCRSQPDPRLVCLVSLPLWRSGPALRLSPSGSVPFQGLARPQLLPLRVTGGQAWHSDPWGLCEWAPALNLSL